MAEVADDNYNRCPCGTREITYMVSTIMALCLFAVGQDAVPLPSADQHVALEVGKKKPDKADPNKAQPPTKIIVIYVYPDGRCVHTVNHCCPCPRGGDCTCLPGECRCGDGCTCKCCPGKCCQVVQPATIYYPARQYIPCRRCRCRR